MIPKVLCSCLGFGSVPLLIIVGALAGCGGDGSVEPDAPAEAAIPPVYLTVAGHIEDVPAYARCDVYGRCRAHLLTFAEALTAFPDVAFNLQIEYEFFVGLSRCEDASGQQETAGLNVIDHLVARHGFEIDPHQEGGVEEGQDNYADIRYLAGTLVSSVSEVVGGLLWDDPAQFARLAQGEPGWIYPFFTWQPQILTLAVSRDHHHGDFSRDDVASGVWRPAGAHENFWVHDEQGPLVYIGPGEHTNWGAQSSNLSTVEYVAYLVENLRQGNLDRTRMYTATVTVPQSIIFDPAKHADLLAILEQLDAFVQAGQAVYVTYSEAAAIWQSHYAGAPNIFRRADALSDAPGPRSYQGK
jgi:hypothetical protein